MFPIIKKTAAGALLAGAAVSLLSACGSNEEEARTFYSDCLSVLSDPELTAELRRASTTADAACTCLQIHLEDDHDDREMVGMFFKQVAAQMEETGAGAEDAAGELVSQSMLASNSSDETTFADTLPVFNNTFEPLMNKIEENGGACPVD